MKTRNILFGVLFTALMISCVGNKSENKEAAAVDDETFYSTQPVHSGLYDAETYNITGTNAKKGHFDGRVYFSLSPATSAFYVYENGNRTKIDYIVNLRKPFEKNDSGLYVSLDTKDRPVTINTDSALYELKFQRTGEDITIGFNPKPRHTGSALDILEKMKAQKDKNN